MYVYIYIYIYIYMYVYIFIDRNLGFDTCFGATLTVCIQLLPQYSVVKKYGRFFFRYTARVK